jgi:hypothetical protein
MFLVWLFRAYANLPSIRSENSEYTPGWAIGWWFIPLANLIKPFQVVRNVWAESDPDVDVGGGFLSSVQSGAPAFMAIWWLFWILSNISANISGRLFDAQDAKNVEVAGYVFIISGILWCVASSLAIKVILSITERQQERFAKVGTLSQFSPPPPPPAFDRPE